METESPLPIWELPGPRNQRPPQNQLTTTKASLSVLPLDVAGDVHEEGDGKQERPQGGGFLNSLIPFAPHARDSFFLSQTSLSPQNQGRLNPYKSDPRIS